MENAKKPIYPVHGADGCLLDETKRCDYEGWAKDSKPFIGLTKREYFAAMAMQGMLANPSNNSSKLYGVNGTDDIGFQALKEITTAAIVHADELLKQLGS